MRHKIFKDESAILHSRNNLPKRGHATRLPLKVCILKRLKVSHSTAGCLHFKDDEIGVLKVSHKRCVKKMRGRPKIKRGQMQITFFLFFFFRCIQCRALGFCYQIKFPISEAETYTNQRAIFCAEKGGIYIDIYLYVPLSQSDLERLPDRATPRAPSRESPMQPI